MPAAMLPLLLLMPAATPTVPTFYMPATPLLPSSSVSMVGMVVGAASMLSTPVPTPSSPVIVIRRVAIPTPVPAVDMHPTLVVHHHVVSSVVVRHTEVTDKAVIRAAVSLQPLAVSGAELHLVLRGIDHPVALSRVQALVQPEVRLAVRGDAHQARPDGPLLPALRAHVAAHVPRPRVAAGTPRWGRHCTQAGPLQPLHHLGEHGVLVEHRPGLEGLPALGAAVGRHGAPFVGLLLVPAVPDAAHAVAVSTGNGHRLLQGVQAHWAAEGVLVL